ncbi:octopamine receptor beta-2R-like [Diadema setosum]|uniref:octopamine receptor beta-2R-like n=1 Tax=Diadema setosum TaxID=31175 RepID=UPI003B3B141A
METPSPADDTANQEPSSVGPLVVASFQIGIGVVGILGNGLCFFVLRLQSKTNNTNWLIVNQCSTDLITSVLLIAATVHLQWFAAPPTTPGLAAELYCRLWDSRIIYFTGFAISSFNLTLISLERYLAVLHPILYMTKFKRRTMYTMAAVSWLTAPILQAVMLFVQFDFDSGQCNYISTGPAIGVVVFFWEYFIPVSIMGYCFICISFKLRSLNRVTEAAIEANTSSVAPQESRENGDESSVAQNTELSTVAKDRDRIPTQASNPSEAQGNVRRRNITITLLIVYLSYLVCWTPNQFVFLVFNFGKIPNYIGSTWHIFTTILATLNICVNPIVYALRYKDFRRGLREALGRCLGKP